MRTRTSRSKAEFFFSNLKQHYWLMILHILILLLLYPLNLVFSSLTPDVNASKNAIEIIAYAGTYRGIHPGAFVLAIFPVLYGVLSFGYLTRESECLRIHSLPVTRRRLYFEQTLSAFCLMVIPYLITALAMLIVEYALPNLTPHLSEIAHWLLDSLFFGTVFLSTAVFASMVIGHPVFIAAFTYILLLLPYGLNTLIDFTLDKFLKGYSIGTGYFSMRLSPMAGFLMANNRGGLSTLSFGFWLNYGLFALVFLALAYWLYQRRALENLEEMVQFPQLKPILKYLASFCTILLFGLIFQTVTNTTTGIILGYLLGGIVGYVLSEMIIQKSLRCQLSVKQLSLFMVIFFAAFSVIATDRLNYGGKTFKIQDIRQVYFSHSPYPGNVLIPGILLDDPATIAAVQKLYQQTSQNVSPLFWLEEYSSARRIPFCFAFVDSNGKLHKRSYSLERPYITPALESVYLTPEYLHYQVPITATGAADIESIHVYDQHHNKTAFLTDSNAIASLLTAVQKDIRNNPKESVSDTRAVPFLSLKFNLSKSDEKNNLSGVDIFPNYTNTLAVLQANPALSPLVLTPDSVTKICIKPIRDYPAGHGSPLNSVEIFDAEDPTVITITDKTRIAALLSTPFYYEGDTMNDSIINIYTNAPEPAFYGYFVGKLPFTL